MQITLSEETSDLLRKVAKALDGYDLDMLVRIWCVGALPAKDLIEMKDQEAKRE